MIHYLVFFPLWVLYILLGFIRRCFIITISINSCPLVIIMIVLIYTYLNIHTHNNMLNINLDKKKITLAVDNLFTLKVNFGIQTID